MKSCLLVNAPLLYRAASQVPFSVLKYAMTLDGQYTVVIFALSIGYLTNYFYTTEKNSDLVKMLCIKFVF